MTNQALVDEILHIIWYQIHIHNDSGLHLGESGRLVKELLDKERPEHD